LADQPLNINPLTEDELDSLRTCLGYFCELAEIAQSTGDSEEGDDLDTPGVCDKIVMWWHRQPEDERPDSETLINCLGAALGEYLRFILRVQWSLIEDEEGEFVALTSESEEDSFILSPFDAIDQGLLDNRDGFIVEAVDTFLSDENAAALLRDDDEEVQSIFPDEESPDSDQPRSS
jgi:hypothetical protein